MKIKIKWTETAEYERVFDLEDDTDHAHFSRLQEAMDDQGAWDQVNWLTDLVCVKERELDEKKVLDEETP